MGWKSLYFLLKGYFSIQKGLLSKWVSLSSYEGENYLYKCCRQEKVYMIRAPIGGRVSKKSRWQLWSCNANPRPHKVLTNFIHVIWSIPCMNSMPLHFDTFWLLIHKCNQRPDLPRGCSHYYIQAMQSREYLEYLQSKYCSSHSIDREEMQYSDPQSGCR